MCLYIRNKWLAESLRWIYLCAISLFLSARADARVTKQWSHSLSQCCYICVYALTILVLRGKRSWQISWKIYEITGICDSINKIYFFIELSYIYLRAKIGVNLRTLCKPNFNFQSLSTANVRSRGILEFRKKPMHCDNSNNSTVKSTQQHQMLAAIWIRIDQMAFLNCFSIWSPCRSVVTAFRFRISHSL